MTQPRSLGRTLGLRLTLTLLVLSGLALLGLYLHTRAIAIQHGGSDLVHAVIAEFFSDLAWGIPLLLVCVVLVGRWTLQHGLAPLRQASLAAQGIGPAHMEQRIPQTDMPAEVLPLVQATNAALDRLQVAYTAQGRFASSAAHEMRTPLAVLRARAETVPDPVLRDQLTTDLDQLTRLTTQLLSMARLEGAPVSDLNTDLRLTLRDVISQTAPQAAERNISIAVDTPVVPVNARADPESVQLILRNLIENAVLHEPPGGEVLVHLAANATVTITDHGPGIPTDWQDRVFTAFRRGPWTTAPGSGLGLAIVAEAAKRIAARVTVASGPGQGAVFTVGFCMGPQ